MGDHDAPLDNTLARVANHTRRDRPPTPADRRPAEIEQPGAVPE